MQKREVIIQSVIHYVQLGNQLQSGQSASCLRMLSVHEWLCDMCLQYLCSITLY